MYDLGAQLQFREISYTVRQLTDSCMMCTREKKTEESEEFRESLLKQYAKKNIFKPLIASSKI